MVTIYGPNEDDSKENTYVFWDLLEAKEARVKIYVASDFNSRVRK